MMVLRKEEGGKGGGEEGERPERGKRLFIIPNSP